MTQVKSAILLVGGYGSRMWPITKVIPKSLLNIVNKPTIHYILEEIIESKIKEIIIVTGPDRSQNLFQEYIDHEWKNKSNVRFIFRTQKLPLGMIDAIQCGLVNDNEPVAVLVGDDILISNPPALKTLLQSFSKIQKPIFSLLKVPRDIAHKYGMVECYKENDIWKITDLIEKPKAKKDIPSDLSIFGRYILTPDIIDIMREMKPTSSKELYLPDIFKIYLKNGGALYGQVAKGIRFDAGSKLGLLEAQVYFGLQDKEIKKEFREFIRNF